MTTDERRCESCKEGERFDSALWTCNACGAAVHTKHVGLAITCQQSHVLEHHNPGYSSGNGAPVRRSPVLTYYAHAEHCETCRTASKIRNLCDLGKTLAAALGFRAGWAVPTPRHATMCLCRHDVGFHRGSRSQPGQPDACTVCTCEMFEGADSVTDGASRG